MNKNTMKNSVINIYLSYEQCERSLLGDEIYNLWGEFIKEYNIGLFDDCHLNYDINYIQDNYETVSDFYATRFYYTINCPEYIKVYLKLKYGSSEYFA